MKKILFLNSKSPYPIKDGAAIGTNQYLRFFHRLGYEVDLVYTSELNDLEVVRNGLSGICSHIYHFHLPKYQSYLKVLKGLITNTHPLHVNYYHSNKVARWVRNHAKDYDILYCHNMRTALYVDGIDSYKIWNIVDAFSMNYESARKNTTGIWHWIYTIDAKRCVKWECKLAESFNKMLIVSERDKQYIETHLKRAADIAVIENYTEVFDNHIPDNVSESRNLVFVGAMNYEPNVTAVTYFCSQILPELLKRYPGIKFYIVGKTPTNSVLALQSDDVIVTGYVDVIWDYLKIATVVVTPMLTGSGIQNKILQALAVGLPVITTPTGFEGLVKDEGQPRVAVDSADMIEQISFLLDHPEVRFEEGKKSKGYILRNYSESVILEKFRLFMEK